MSLSRVAQRSGILTIGLCTLGFILYAGAKVSSAPDAHQSDEGGAAVERHEAVELPVRRVVLFSSGVGYIERAGAVEGNAEITLQFRADDINDLLKSLLVEDLDGGQVTAVNYTSRDPVTRTLKSFAVDLTENPSMYELLEQLRGEPVVLQTTRPIEGTVVSVEEKLVRKDDGELTYSQQFVNLLTANGLVSIPIEQVQHIEVQNERIRQELAQALDVLATAHDTQKKTVVLRCEGEGRRRIRVAYIRELPVWKTTYRLALEGSDAFLQGWAIVDNTTDEDWDNVAMALVSGRPVSFRMDLYEPIYVERPEVELKFDVAVRPPVHEGRIEQLAEKGAASRMLRRAAAPAPGGVAAMEAADAAFGAMAGGRLQTLAASAAVAATGATVGEQFQYVIRHPVVLPRQQSALLPIVSAMIDDFERLSIYNESTHARHPMRGLRFKNTTGAHLMRGPITVYDEGAYAGDAQIDDTPADMTRLISYALDTDLVVEAQRRGTSTSIVQVRIVRGVIVTTRKQVTTKVYRIANRSEKQKKLIIEHPIQGGWQLVEPSPVETTASYYRFAVEVGPGESKEYVVREERQDSESVELSSLSPDRVMFYLRMRQVSDKVKEALQHLVELQSKLAQVRAEKDRLNNELQRILKDQERIRENLRAIDRNSTLAQEYLKKLQDQEAQIERMSAQLRELEQRELELNRQVSEYLKNLTVD